VRSPQLVRELDWIENTWPVALRARGIFPRAQYYCLMSVAGCYTDWHIGSSCLVVPPLKQP
jgi:hypothetical protein